MFASHIYKDSGKVATDPNFNNVSLLLHGDGTNGSQNNTFLDSSTNNLAITRNGAATQGSFSPYGRWSNYFDGSGDYLDAPSNAAFQFGTGAFTVEFWVYLNEYKITTFVDFRSGQVSQIAPTIYASETGSIRYWVNGAIRIIGATIPLNTWTHIALSRSGTNTKLFFNGAQTGFIYTDNNNYILSPCRIGAPNNGTATEFVNGYISNVRVVKGAALYTANFTPPTSPLTAVAGTSLLTCQSNRFVDNSSNNFTITATGNTSVQPNSPFNPTSEYSITTNGGSGYFNGTTDYLRINSTTPFNFDLADFTIECWVNVNRTSGSHGICDSASSLGGQTLGKWRLAIEGGNITFARHGDGGLLIFNYTITSFNANTWYHIAVSRQSGTFYLFLNGQQVSTSTLSVNFDNAGGLNIGAVAANTYLSGHLSNLRIIKGTALYTANFSVPTSPVTLTSNGGATPSTAPTSGQVSLLCNFTNAAIFDNAAKNNLITVGTSQISTAQKKYGTGSMLFNGSTDYCRTIAPAGTHQFGTGDFTIECWAYCTNLAGGASSTMILVDFRQATTTEVRPTLEIRSSSFAYTTNNIVRITSSTISINTWYHVAVVRSSGSTKLYVNGTNVGVTYADTNNYLDGTPTIGNYLPIPSYGFAGYIDDVRITKGIARYTANFTPPTQAFPNL